MTNEERQMLVSLLHKYMDEVGAQAFGKSAEIGSKSQYEHARILSTKLAKQVNDNIKGWM